MAGYENYTSFLVQHVLFHFVPMSCHDYLSSFHTNKHTPKNKTLHAKIPLVWIKCTMYLRVFPEERKAVLVHFCGEKA